MQTPQPQTTTPRPPGREPILPLTSVRIAAAMYVVIVHSVVWGHNPDVSTWLGRFMRNGYVAVGFFFTLSGYILAHVYLNTERPLNRRAFWTSRFARVYPLLFASLLFDLPQSLLIRLSLYRPTTAIARTLLSLLSESALLQAWDIHFRNINAPSWSLSAEAFFYLLFPFAALWIWRRKGLHAFGLLLLFWICAMLVPFLVTLRHPELSREVSASALQTRIMLLPPLRIFEFFAGISLCVLQQSLVSRFSVSRRSHLAYLTLAVASFLFVIAIAFANYIPIMVMSNGALLPIFSLVILSLVNLRGWLARLMSNKLLVLLGEASYAVYLLHLPIMLYFKQLHAIDGIEPWLLFVACVMAVSIASFYLIERPAREKILSFASLRSRVTLHQEAVAPTHL
jgi:peptidoglycan/LPS O-acetylase OafA/YrhL